jgi:hypothetical protein
MAEHYAGDGLSNFADVTIIGGEPTLVPPNFYEECLPYVRERFNATGKEYILAIVTNFTSTNALKRYAHHFDVVTTSYEYDRFDNQLLTSLNTKKSLWWKNLEDWIQSGLKIFFIVSASASKPPQGDSPSANSTSKVDIGV